MSRAIGTALDSTPPASTSSSESQQAASSLLFEMPTEVLTMLVKASMDPIPLLSTCRTMERIGAVQDWQLATNRSTNGEVLPEALRRRVKRWEMEWEEVEKQLTVLAYTVQPRRISRRDGSDRTPRYDTRSMLPTLPLMRNLTSLSITVPHLPVTDSPRRTGDDPPALPTPWTELLSTLPQLRRLELDGWSPPSDRHLFQCFPTSSLRRLALLHCAEIHTFLQGGGGQVSHLTLSRPYTRGVWYETSWFNTANPLPYLRHLLIVPWHSQRVEWHEFCEDFGCVRLLLHQLLLEVVEMNVSDSSRLTRLES